MTGETDLITLLNNLSPSLDQQDYVFCTVAEGLYGDLAELSPLAAFVEAEGLTLVLPKSTADSAGMAYQGSFKYITLNLGVVGSIFLSWLVTLPAGAGLSILFFFGFKAAFGQ